MTKKNWKGGTMLYPVPAVLVSCCNSEKNNIITVAWTGIVCSNPPMLYVSIRPERFSYDLIRETGDFVVNLPTKDLTFVTDFCGVKSGRDIDKFTHLNLSAKSSKMIKSPYIEECPINLECKVEKIVKLGSHDMFISEILCVNVDEDLIDENEKLNLDKAELICYSHGEYYTLSKSLGHFGYSIRHKKKIKRER